MPTYGASGSASNVFQNHDTAHSSFGHKYVPEGCVLVGPQSAWCFTFSDLFLTILLTMHLVSNKVDSNRTKITVFLHISYIYLRTCHPSSPKFELLKIVSPGRWKKVSKTWQTVLRESNTTRNVRDLTLFSSFYALQNVGKVHVAS